MGRIILREVALEPVADAGDKACGLDGLASGDCKRQHLVATWLVQQREILDSLETGLLRIQNSESLSALGLEQVCENPSQFGHGSLCRRNAITPVGMNRCREIAQGLDLDDWDLRKIGLFLPQERDGVIIGQTLRAVHERFDGGEEIILRGEQVVLKLGQLI